MKLGQRRKMKRMICLAAMVLPVFASLTGSQERKILRVGVSPMSPPIQYWEKNKLAGLEIDFADKLGEELGREVEYVDLKFEKLIPALLNNEIDIIMAGMSSTKIRELQVAFATPYMRVGQMPLVRLEDRNLYNFPLDVVMTDKRIGAQENTTSEYLLVKEFPKAKKKLFASHSNGLSALKSKKIDLLILDSPYVLWMAMKSDGKLAVLPFLLTEESLAWAVRKSETDLLESVNIALAKWKETGQMDAMIKNQIPGFN